MKAFKLPTSQLKTFHFVVINHCSFQLHLSHILWENFPTWIRIFQLQRDSFPTAIQLQLPNFNWTVMLVTLSCWWLKLSDDLCIDMVTDYHLLTKNNKISMLVGLSHFVSWSSLWLNEKERNELVPNLMSQEFVEWNLFEIFLDLAAQPSFRPHEHYAIQKLRNFVKLNLELIINSRTSSTSQESQFTSEKATLRFVSLGFLNEQGSFYKYP